MKITAFILILFSYNIGFSQSQTNNSQDTLYVYFKHSKHEILKGPRLFMEPNVMEKTFTFDFNDSNHYYEFVNYSHRKTKEGFLEIPVLAKKKKFLKQNKKKLLKYCEVKKMSFDEIEKFYWDNKNRPIYLIDKKENKKGQIFLRRVSFYSAYQIQQ